MIKKYDNTSYNYYINYVVNATLKIETENRRCREL